MLKGLEGFLGLEEASHCANARYREASKALPHAAPLKLTHSELDAVFAAARPLDPDVRDVFLCAVATALKGREFGPGLVARTCAELQRQFFDPPLDEHRQDLFEVDRARPSFDGSPSAPFRTF